MQLIMNSREASKQDLHFQIHLVIPKKFKKKIVFMGVTQTYCHLKHKLLHVRPLYNHEQLAFIVIDNTSG
jgi:hypothetical protein